MRPPQERANGSGKIFLKSRPSQFAKNLVSDTMISIMTAVHIVSVGQIVLAVLLICGVLLQQSEAGLGGAFGGGDGFSSGHHSKRGAEKYIFVGTIVVAILFAVTSFSLLLV